MKIKKLLWALYVFGIVGHALSALWLGLNFANHAPLFFIFLGIGTLWLSQNVLMYSAERLVYTKPLSEIMDACRQLEQDEDKLNRRLWGAK